MMDERVIKNRLVVLVVMIAALLIAWWPELGEIELDPPICDSTLLCVVFLDVGQGDAIFIQSPSGKQMLIDSGRDSSVLRQLGEVMSFSDRNIDYVLATHPDADHIGGLAVVLDRFSVSNVIRTENESDTGMWEVVERKIEEEGAVVHYVRRGQRYDLGSNVYIEILFPDIDASELESNTSSIVARLVYSDTAFMFTGDSPKSIEEYLVLVEGENLESDVLKAGHHGSRTSTSELFLAEVDPEYAVISAGKDNSYGHPHLEVTDMLFNFGVETLNTAEEGNVVFWSDGENVIHK